MPIADTQSTQYSSRTSLVQPTRPVNKYSAQDRTQKKSNRGHETYQGDFLRATCTVLVYYDTPRVAGARQDKKGGTLLTVQACDSPQQRSFPRGGRPRSRTPRCSLCGPPAATSITTVGTEHGSDLFIGGFHNLGRHSRCHSRQ